MRTQAAARLILSTVVTLWLPSLCLSQIQPNQPAAKQTISLEEVVDSVKGGMPEELIIARLKRVNRPFDLSPAEFVELRRLGVSETVMKYLIDPAQPYAPAGAAAPAPSGGTAPSASIAPPPSASKPPPIPRC